MPADHSKPNPTARTRRNARKDNDEDRLDSLHSREIELKRSRGEISCAECRRLKIRCDKTIPCQSCQRRGCAALCPNGSLATGQGTRFVLAATEHLHKRIARMGERIRQLEDALAILQAKCSNEPHPLLQDDPSTNVNGEQENDGPALGLTEVKPSQGVIEAFGTLSVYDHGVSRFFGPSGGPEYLLYAGSDSPSSSPSAGSKSPESLRDSSSPSVSSEVIRFSAAFPFTPMGPAGAVLEIIEGHLPSWERACHLSEAYIEHAAWLFRGVSKEQLLLEMLPSIYRRPIPEGASIKDDYNGPHDYALLYLIFAIGALLDLNQEPYNAEGEHYHQLARAALCLQPVLEKPSPVTIQALHLLSIYNGLAGNEAAGGETSLETTWSLVAFAAQLSQSIGLHRDTSRWGLSDDVVNRRRLLFWNLFVADSWQSLTTGRPPSFSRQYIDCKFPVTEGGTAPEGEPENDFGTWGFRFALECVSEVAARTLTAEAPSYATIMELDRKVREFPIPAEAAALLEDLKTPSEGEEPLPLSISMTRFVLSHSREVILLSIHRAFFAQAIIDCSDNPLRSQYAPSFLASYRASCTILKAINDQYTLLPTLLSRFWVTWTYAFSAAVVFGTVVTRGPRSPLATQAIAQLNIACELFTKASKLSRRAAKALPILNKLKEKADCALSAAKTDRSHNGALWGVDPSEDADELEIFAGKTRLVESKRLSPSPSLQSAPSGGSESQPQQSPHDDTMSAYEQQDYKSLIAPPTVPVIPQAPLPASNSLSPTSTWYPQSHGYSNSYAPQQLSPSQPPSAYAVQHAYSEPHAGYAEQQWQQPMREHAPHLQPPQPSHPHQHVSHSQTPLHGLPHLRSMQYTNAVLPVATPAQYRAPQQQESYIRDQRNEHPQAYPMDPSFQGMQQNYMPPAELVALGFASRESRLDERWASFIHESGYLDGINFNGRT